MRSSSAPRGSTTGSSGVVAVVAVVAVVSVLVTACGSSTKPARSVASVSSTTTTPRGVVRGVEQCGTVVKAGGRVAVSGRERDPEGCFAAAVHACTPAAFVYSEHGIDTAIAHRFTLARHGTSCTVSDSVLQTTVPFRVGKAEVAACTTFENDATGMHVHGCGKFGDIDVPAVK